jgi:uncharacterized protein
VKGPCKVGIRATITNLNVNRQLEIVEHLAQMGIRCIYADDVFITAFNKKQMQESGYGAPDMMVYVNELLKAKIAAKSLGVYYGSWLSVNFLAKTDRACTACIPYPRLTSDGFVSSCDVAFLGRNGPKEFVYGEWDESTGIIKYDENRKRFLTARSLANMKQCNKCTIGPYCAGSCMGKTYITMSSVNKQNPVFCRATRFLAKHLGVEQPREEFEYEHP